MRSSALGLVLLLSGLVSATDDHEHHYNMSMASTADAPIIITINPEARVSVALGGGLPKPSICGTAADLEIKVINQGFITARLEAQLVDPPQGMTLDFHPEPLRGIPEETRALQLTLSKPGATDVTVAFKAHNEIPDLGGRDRIHFLMRCISSQAGGISTRSTDGPSSRSTGSLPTPRPAVTAHLP